MDSESQGYSGFIILFDEERRQEILKDRGSVNWGFSDALSSTDWEMKSWNVCLLSFDGKTFAYACLGLRGKKVATAKYRVEFSDLLDLKNVPISKIEQLIDVRLAAHFVRSTTGRGGRVPPRTWAATIGAIKRLRLDDSDDLDRLLGLREASTKSVSERGVEIVSMERDAVAVALDVFDASHELRTRTLRRWLPAADGGTPFLAGVDTIKVSEEQMLAHDSNVFPNADIRQNSLGAEFRLGKRRLHVIYLNRTSIEKTLGVDLIYYSEDYSAYTLVQYKRMQHEHFNGRRIPVYRPSADHNFEIEISRMRAFRKKYPDVVPKPGAFGDYRLNADGFFFKFCPAIVPTVLSAEMIGGMYIPREYLEHLLDSDLLDGPRHGKIVTFDNVQRHIPTTDFAKLVASGWIGTRALSSSAIQSIIRDALSADRSVVYAGSEQLVG